MEFNELLKRIKECPEMYLGEATISRLEVFLQGWILGSDSDSGKQFVREFQAWIASRFRVKTSHSWADIIRFYAKNEVAALSDAFSLIDEFRHEVQRATQT